MLNEWRQKQRQRTETKKKKHTLNDKISVFEIIKISCRIFVCSVVRTHEPFFNELGECASQYRNITITNPKTAATAAQFNSEWKKGMHSMSSRAAVTARKRETKQPSRTIWRESKRCYGDAILLIHYMFAFSIHLLLLLIRWARCFHSFLFVCFGCRFELLIEHTEQFIFVILGVQQEFELVCVRMFRMCLAVREGRNDSGFVHTNTHTVSTSNTTLLILYKYGDYLCRHIYTVFTIELLNRQKPKAYETTTTNNTQNPKWMAQRHSFSS